VGAVQPLPDRKQARLHTTPVEPVARQFQQDEAAALRDSLSDGLDVSTLLDTDEALSFRRPGIGPDVTRKLRKGDWAIQREIDLHGPHGACEQMALGLAALALGRLRRRFGLGACVRGLQFFLNLLQVLQGCELHAPARLRIQSAVWKKLWFKRSCSRGSTPVSVMAWSMQASHWSRSAMPIENGMWRMRRRGWPKRSW